MSKLNAELMAQLRRQAAKQANRRTKEALVAPVAKPAKKMRKAALKFDRTVYCSWLSNSNHADWATNYRIQQAARVAAAKAAREGWLEAVKNAPAKTKWFDQERLPKPEVVEIDGAPVALDATELEGNWSGRFCSHYVERAITGAPNCGWC